jgi:hypothetical protein
LRFGEREEGDVRIVTGDRLDDRARRGNGDNARAAAERGSRREKDRARVA